MSQEPTDGTGTLYLVPTPIGDTRDITNRAIEVLAAADVIACEDTRNTRTLLNALGVDHHGLLSYHEHNEQSRTVQLLARLESGADVAVVSDAGTPLVNDPGFRLVSAAIDLGIPVRPLPGANAPITALIGSGLPVHHFHYLGFLPRRGAARRAALEAVRTGTATLLLFEAPHRIVEMLEDVRTTLGERRVALARNLTKTDEEFLRGPISEVIAGLEALETVRGQFTVVIEGKPDSGDHGEEAAANELIAVLLRHGVDGRAIRDVVCDVTGLSRNRAYALISAQRATTED